jgi:hypothetical protein
LYTSSAWRTGPRSRGRLNATTGCRNDRLEPATARSNVAARRAVGSPAPGSVDRRPQGELWADRRRAGR